MPPEEPNESSIRTGDWRRRTVLRGLAAGGTLSLGALVAKPAAAHDLDVRFKGCTVVLIVVNDPDEFGVLEETIHVFDAESGEEVSVEVELTRENTYRIPGAFEGKPVFAARARKGDVILAVETGDGREFENPHDCPTEKRDAKDEEEEEEHEKEEEKKEEDEEKPTGDFAVRQGEECIPIEPLSFEDESIEEFYGYEPDEDAENPRQPNFPVALEEAQTSRLFLYEGPDGLSLVFVHGGDDDPGGAASFEITGLDDDVEWLVEDDGYEGATDQFSLEDETATADWAWGAEGRNDGGALGYLDDDFELSIDPRFNEDAELEPFDGEEAVVEQWQVLSGDVDDPEVTDLSLDQPIEISSESC